MLINLKTQKTSIITLGFISTFCDQSLFNFISCDNISIFNKLIIIYTDILSATSSIRKDFNFFFNADTLSKNFKFLLFPLLNFSSNYISL